MLVPFSFVRRQRIGFFRKTNGTTAAAAAAASWNAFADRLLGSDRRCRGQQRGKSCTLNLATGGSGIGTRGTSATTVATLHQLFAAQRIFSIVTKSQDLPLGCDDQSVAFTGAQFRHRTLGLDADQGIDGQGFCAVGRDLDFLHLFFLHQKARRFH